MAEPRAFPFVPTSLTQVEPGDFWGIELLDGTWGCAVVVKGEHARLPRSKVVPMALVDWRGEARPTVESLGSPIRFEPPVVGALIAITILGGQIDGTLPAEAVDYEPLPRLGAINRTGMVAWANRIHLGLDGETVAAGLRPRLEAWFGRPDSDSTPT